MTCDLRNEWVSALPHRQGLYDPQNEHDSCGVGFVADMKGRASHAVIRQGLQILMNLEHRGAVGADPLASDGAGVLIQTPDRFLRAVCAEIGIVLPPRGDYAAGMVFLPKNAAARKGYEALIERFVVAEGQTVLGWRSVPVDATGLGETVKPTEPFIRQVFIGRGTNVEAGDAFERKLFVIRKQIAGASSKAGGPGLDDFYIPSMSSRTIVYKGMLLAAQVGSYYLDLADERMESALALVHQRFSTNTFPSWRLAHPFRLVCHNGEINTLRGNLNWMAARRHSMRSKVLGADLDKLWPLIPDGQSDTACFDNALELLVAAGYPLAHAMMMLIPEAWAGRHLMNEQRRAFYEYHAALMEPWDGPAAVAFTDGRQIGATLDRNGLRPARWFLTDDHLLVMASEVGVLDIPASKIVKQWRLQPGRMLLVDLEEGRIIEDSELKNKLAAAHPYKRWLEETQIRLEQLPHPKPKGGNGQHPTVVADDPASLLDRQQVFGYTQEDLRFFLVPMAVGADDPVGSMGTDTPISVLSRRPKLLYSYFKQNFAQVTNPPIDPIREELVMSLVSMIGPRPNLLELDHGGTHLRLEVRQPVLTNADIDKIKHAGDIAGGHFATRTLDITWPADQGAQGIGPALDRLCADAYEAVRTGFNILILSDRAAGRERIPVPALLATSAVHHHLIREGVRTETGIVVETGEAREIHHFALLAGYGAEAINPYLAFESLRALLPEMGQPISEDEAVEHYIKAVDKGLLKVMSKMGISTYQSYCGAQIFDAVGLSSSFVEKYFTRTATVIEGIGLGEVAQEAVLRHRMAYGDAPIYRNMLDVGGEYAYRLRGEEHSWSPETIAKLQHAVRGGGIADYRAFAEMLNDQSKRNLTLRGLFDMKLADKPIPLDEVEPAKEIVKRFATGAMSYGSISLEAHSTMAIAMNRIGGRSNTGEGGEEPARYELLPGGDSARSRIAQVASGRFGVTTQYLAMADDLQIKMAQGAKPGEGGQLPGHKVDAALARVRHSTPGVGLISPPPHHDIYSIEDLAQLIHDLKNVNPQARISVKLVSEVGVGTVAAGVSKAKADHVTISGFEGGTGASPLTSLTHAGSPWEIGLAETHQTLVMNNLRGRIAVQVDGGVRTGRDVVIGALLGADEFGFATAPLVAQGCIMMRKCHLNTCPVGIATQDPELRAKFAGKPEHVINYFFFVAEEVREWMAKMGFRSFSEMIGRRDRLDVHQADDHWKAHGLNLSRLLYMPPSVPGVATHHCQTQDHGLDQALDRGMIERARPALENKKPVRLEIQVRNGNRTVGAMLSGEVAKRYGHAGLPEDTISIAARGVGGQSFGAWLAHGVSIELQGIANDYVGKGLSGGRIVIYPPADSPMRAAENIIVGNTVLYGAISGECYFSGVAGERFAVRNSGAVAVVEGLGDHGCEYMTGGVIVVLGATGVNFAAGMSGGIAYILDEDGRFESRCNRAQVELTSLAGAAAPASAAALSDAEFARMTHHDERRLKTLVERHVHYTNSVRGRAVLENWSSYLPKFVKVMPVDFQRALQEQQAKQPVAFQEIVDLAHG